jgi:uncharacterized protein (TIGR03435 family)
MGGRLIVFVAAFLVTTSTVRLLGQGQHEQKPLAFEVASVKPTVGREPVSVAFQPGGRFRAINADVFSLIALSYARGLLPFFPSQIVGAPDWTRLERYDITAKVSDQLAATDAAGLQAKLPALIQTLLEDRFKLRVRREQREQQIYVLHRVRKDGSFGPKLRRGTDCAPNPVVDALSSFLGDCRLGARVTPGHITGRSIPLVQLVTMLSLDVGRTIVDETGLEGVLEVDLEWSPDQSVTDKPSLFTALEEQLGLKLESTRRSAEVLVIERVERPTPD